MLFSRGMKVVDRKRRPEESERPASNSCHCKDKTVRLESVRLETQFEIEAPFVWDKRGGERERARSQNEH